MVAFVDTLSIFEQFRDVLGEDKAKAFAQTLGRMIEEAKNAATKDDLRLVRESLDASTARLDRLEQAVEKLAKAQLQTEARLDRLEQAVEKLAERMNQLTAVVEKLVVRSDRHEGTLLELKFRDRLPSYLGRYLRRARVLQPADLLDEVEPRLESPEVDDFLRADVLAQGIVDGEPTYVIGEVSYTADASDVERAARRAALLRKATLPAVGLVACEAARPETLAYAREQGVRIWLDGVLLDERRA